MNKIPRIANPWIRVIVFAAFFLIVNSIMSSIIVIFISYHTADPALLENYLEFLSEPQNNSYLALLLSSSLFASMFLTILFRSFIDRRDFFSLGFTLKGVKWHIIVAFLSGYIMIGSGFLINYLSSRIIIADVSMIPILLLFYLVMTICISLNEEIVVRGYMLNNLLKTGHPVIAVIITSLFFAILHAVNPGASVIGVINTGLFGLLAGFYYMYQKNLWFPIVLHTSWNFFQGPIFGFEVSGYGFFPLIEHRRVIDDLISGGEFGFEGSILSTIFLTLGTIGTIYLFKNKALQSQSVSDS